MTKNITTGREREVHRDISMNQRIDRMVMLATKGTRRKEVQETMVDIEVAETEKKEIAAIIEITIPEKDHLAEEIETILVKSIKNRKRTSKKDKNVKLQRSWNKPVS